MMRMKLDTFKWMQTWIQLQDRIYLYVKEFTKTLCINISPVCWIESALKSFHRDFIATFLVKSEIETRIIFTHFEEKLSVFYAIENFMRSIFCKKALVKLRIEISWNITSEKKLKLFDKKDFRSGLYKKINNEDHSNKIFLFVYFRHKP